jgi:hypothetical protein
MDMVRLIYFSELSQNIKRKDLENIVESSRKNNPRHGITGMLCYDPKFFLQWIEGPRNAVNALYVTLCQDTRHVKMTILEYSEITSREFGEWEMAYFSTFDTDEKILKKYAHSAQFNPLELSAVSARLFLIEIAHQKQSFLKELGAGKARHKPSKNR